VQCYNRGFDGVDVQWECKADLPSNIRFGDVTVACEGYDYPDDPNILTGSCGLEYTLHTTNSDDRYGSYKPRPYGSSSGWGSSMFVLVLFAIVVYYIYTNCVSTRAGGGLGGGRRWGGDYPPPPYPGSGSGGFGGGFGNDGSYKNSQSSYGAAGSAPIASPGFWSGMLGGGALGYMLGRNNNNAYGGYQQPWGGGFSNRGFGGGFGGGGMRMASGGGTRSASGFGGTRRR